MINIPSSMQPLQKDTLQDGVYKNVCQLLLEGGIAPGQTVTVASLTEAFQVSPMPVREAISRLVAIGALTTISGRSVGPPKITKEKLIELRNVRMEVETVAASWAIKNVQENDIKKLEQLFSNLKDAEIKKDTSAYISANYDFHFTIYTLAKSDLLLGIIRNLWLQITPSFHLLKESGNFQLSNEIHANMLKALKDNKKAQLISAIRADLSEAYNSILKIVET